VPSRRSPDDPADATAAVDRERRWSTLLELLAANGRLSVVDASRTLGVSVATIRRDFAALAAQQLAARTHGGVVSTSVAYALPARYRSAAREDAKDRVAARAGELIPVGSVVGLNGGTTTTLTARHLARRTDLAGSADPQPLTVVTNALNIAVEMVLRPFIRCVTLGGVARPESYEVTGPLASLVLEQLWLDTAVLGVGGIDEAAGVTCSQEGEAEISALMTRRCDRVIVVATGDKLGRRAFAQICRLGDIDILITDDSAPAAARDLLRNNGVEVITV
jgi:DeoR family transcriptional regulator of aga operon